jgi:hypothetical protein
MGAKFEGEKILQSFKNCHFPEQIIVAHIFFAEGLRGSTDNVLAEAPALLQSFTTTFSVISLFCYQPHIFLLRDFRPTVDNALAEALT